VGAGLSFFMMLPPLLSKYSKKYCPCLVRSQSNRNNDEQMPEYDFTIGVKMLLLATIFLFGGFTIAVIYETTGISATTFLGATLLSLAAACAAAILCQCQQATKKLHLYILKAYKAQPHLCLDLLQLFGGFFL
jgi:hypothetical protein